MASDWDMPVQQGREDSRTGTFRAGALDPLALASFVMRNVLKIGILALAFALVGLAVVRVIPFPYSATAVVLVDPREQNVTLQEDVLRPIGSDSAVLESMVQIVRTDGFLLPLLTTLGMIEDTTSAQGREERLKALADFRRNLTVERRGATYLVEITYRGATSEESARIANAVAQTFVDYHNGALTTANENAARALSERLVELRRNVTESEQAVADFQARNGIIYLEQGGTVQKRQLAELSAQLAAARNATEQARARYEEALKGGSSEALSGAGDLRTAQFNYLRQQRAQMERDMAEAGTVYGPRHPRIELTRQAIANLDRQIAQEQQLLTAKLQKDLEVAQALQQNLTNQLNQMSAGVSMTDSREVELEALRREAAADRAIYESFLNRNKATDELAAIGGGNVRVVSEAIAPLRSTRPSTALLGVALTLLGFVLASAGLIALNPPSGPGRRTPPVGQDQMSRSGTENAARAGRPDPRPRTPSYHGGTMGGSLLRPDRNGDRGGSLLNLGDSPNQQPGGRRRYS